VRVAQTPPDNGGTPPDNGGTPNPPPPDGPPPDQNPQPPPPPPPPAGNDQSNTAKPDTTDEDLAKMADEAAKTQNEEIITVTGSLVERRELTTPSPISVLDKEKLSKAGLTNVGDILQKLPSQGNAINAQVNNGGDGSTRISLRSLGDNRTLVLLNGRRLVPSGTGADASVDMGTIPLAMVERIEVLKDGASAIYGSDAIAGVVNVITRQDFQGTEAAVYTATSQKGDGTNYDLSFVSGHSSKNGNITFSAGYQRQYAVMAGDRGPFASIYDGYEFAPDTAETCMDGGPSTACAGKDGIPGTADDLPNGAKNPNYGKAGGPTPTGSSAVPGGRLRNNLTDAAGNPIPIPGCDAMSRYCTYDTKLHSWRDFVGPAGSSLGDNYNFQPLNYVYTPSQRFNLFAQGHQDLTKNVRMFFEGMYQNRKSEQQLAAEPLFAGLYGTPVSADSLYNPFGADVVNYNRRMTEFGPRVFDQNVDTKRAVVGLDGKLDEEFGPLKGWKWETSFNYGRTDAISQYHGSLILSHLQNALGPSMIDPGSGAPICVGTPGDPTTAIPGCVPLSILTPNTASPDAINYLTFTGTAQGFNEQRTTMATAHGKLMDLPNHGDISLAVGGDYRHEAGGYEPDPLTATGDTTGNQVAPTHGSYHLFEGYSELSVVPVSGMQGAQWVELDAAARAYDYNLKDIHGNVINGATYKLGGLWRTGGGVSLRGTYGTAFRAPHISELYSGASDDFPNVNDPCDTAPNGTPMALPAPVKTQCASNNPWGGIPANQLNENDPQAFAPGTAQQRSKIGGNAHLQPEKAKNATIGIVYEPLKGLAFTLDYWNIQIDNTIGALPASTILTNCYIYGNCLDKDTGTPLVIRNKTTHEIDYIMDTLHNIGTTWTSGTDFAVSYSWKQPEYGQFRHALEGTWLHAYNVDNGTKIPDPKTGKEVPYIFHYRNYYDGGVLPDLKWNLFTSWEHPSGFGAGFNFRFINGFMECGSDADQNDCNNYQNRDKQTVTVDPNTGMPLTTPIKNFSYSRQVDRYYTGDIFVNYTFKSSAGGTRIAAGINNVANVSPPIIYQNLAFNSDESAYDFMGRYFYLRLSQLY
jgi:outer membrane receptor protein involved in Fe transport